MILTHDLDTMTIEELEVAYHDRYIAYQEHVYERDAQGAMVDLMVAHNYLRELYRRLRHAQPK